MQRRAWSHRAKVAKGEKRDAVHPVWTKIHNPPIGTILVEYRFRRDLALLISFLPTTHVPYYTIRNAMPPYRKDAM